MDYFLADPVSVPKENITQFSEKVWHLPKTRLCFTPPTADITQDVSLLPALKNSFVTFGCFQDLSKINDRALALWATILQHCPHSKMILKNNQLKDNHVKQQLLDDFKRLNITADRIILEEGGSRTQYFSAYHSVDFLLDTFPFPGGTTTCEALWMGIPTLTLAGNTLLERQGMSLLNCVNPNDCIADDEEAYIQKAIFFAKDFQHLNQLRQQLRATMKNSPLVDAASFAFNLERALLDIWSDKFSAKNQA